MFRASSEIAVVMRTESVVENPIFEASSRPFWRAFTMSSPQPIGTISSSCSALSTEPGLSSQFPRSHIEEAEPLFQVESSRNVLQHQSELDHRERHFGLDPDDDGLRAAEPDHVRD